MTAESNIIPLPGVSTPTPLGVPVGDVVEILERYLRDAKAGQLRAVAVAGVLVTDSASPLITTAFDAANGQSFVLEAAICRLARRYGQFNDE